MAWKAKLTAPITFADSSVIAAVAYYDDADTSTIFYNATFSFSAAWSTTDMQSAIQDLGAKVRAAKARADALAVQFPTATTVIPIP